MILKLGFLLAFCLIASSACTVEATPTFSFAPQPVTTPTPLKRRQLYAGTLSKLRQLMICRMAKPEEVGAPKLFAWYWGQVLVSSCARASGPIW